MSGSDIQKIVNFLGINHAVVAAADTVIDVVSSYLLNESTTRLVVCNLSPKSSRGSHWVTLLLEPNLVRIIDSCAESPVLEVIMRKIALLRCPTECHHKGLQTDGWSCGYWCLVFCWFCDLQNYDFDSSVEKLMQIEDAHRFICEKLISAAPIDYAQQKPICNE